MATRKKRLIKQKKSLLKQAQKHFEKAKTEIGSKDTTKDYWIAEAERFIEQAKKRDEMLRKLKKKKNKR